MLVNLHLIRAPKSTPNIWWLGLRTLEHLEMVEVNLVLFFKADV